MVADDNKHPLSDTTSVGQQSSRARLESGEFAKKSQTSGNVLASSAPSPLTIVPKKGPREDSNSSSGSGGGEFTRIEIQEMEKPKVEATGEYSQFVAKITPTLEPIKTPSSGHVSRIQSFGGTMNEQMLDELIAMSTTELMNDLGLQPPAHKKSLRASTNPKLESEDTSFRRRATSSDTATAQKSLRQLAKLKHRRSDQTEAKKDETKEAANAAMRSSSSDAKLRLAKDAKRRSRSGAFGVVVF